jgi:hypothetical protein
MAESVEDANIVVQGEMPVAAEETEEEKIIRKTKEKDKKREMVVAEIVKSEAVYVNRLRITIDVFIKNFRENNILSEQDIRGQFGKWEVIFGVNSSLLEDLKKMSEQNDMTVGKIFKHFSPYFKMYGEYVCAYEEAMVRRAKLMTSQKRFAEALEKARQDPRYNICRNCIV